MSGVQQLMEMGFPEVRAKRALYVCKNNVGAAMDWIFNNMDDPNIDRPLSLEEEEGFASGNSLKLNLGGNSAKPQDEITENLGEIERGSMGEEEGKDKNESTNIVEEARSIKCDDCGKLLKNEDDAQAHAIRTQHANFSQSTEAVKPLTPEEKAEQLARLQAKIAEKKLMREEQEKKEAIEKEKLRRKQGKEVVTAKEYYQTEMAKRNAQDIAKRKKEDAALKAKLRKEIELDRAERARKQSHPVQPVVAPVSIAPTESVIPTQSEATTTPIRKTYTDCKLQLRLPTGSTLVHTFAVNDNLCAVVDFVTRSLSDADPVNGCPPFHLLTTFPRKVFGNDDMMKTLAELGLVPSAVLVVAKN